jgi:hypothetical protein
MGNVLTLPAAGLSACLLALSLGSPALAQSAGPDEAVQPNGAVTQPLALTAAQKIAIYNAIVGLAVRPRAERISLNVGAPVPPFAELHDLPDQAGAGNPAHLKYAMVENDVVVVDPVMMRVVDVIRSGARP